MWTVRKSNGAVEEHAVVDENGINVCYVAKAENPDFERKRAILFAHAPETLNCLADLVNVCRKELPEHLQLQLRRAEDVLKQIEL